jgi:RNA polymerase-binding transcription factor DksA
MTNNNPRNLDLNHYRSLLNAEQERLVSNLEKMAYQDDTNPDDWVPIREDLNISNGESVEAFELAEEIQEFESQTATVKELEARLNEVKAALERIEDGTYGIDEVDGSPIDEDRLHANPAARSSVDNAPTLEQEPLTENEIE